jgi:hypothetical protein
MFVSSFYEYQQLPPQEKRNLRNGIVAVTIETFLDFILMLVIRDILNCRVTYPPYYPQI